MPSQWAERYRILSRKQSSRWGRWDNQQAPYLVGYMDIAFRFPRIRKVNMKKFAQGGMSEAFRNIIGSQAHQDPDPQMLVLPNKEKGREIFDKRIMPMFEDTPTLRELKTERARDQKMTKIELGNGFVLQLAWSGSPASLASDPVKIVYLDEVDKMSSWVGVEASPIQLAEVRTATYVNSVTFRQSTPTTRLGHITQMEEQSAIRLRYFVPCPHCRTYQTLDFARLKFTHDPKLTDDPSRAAAVQRDHSAWYECSGCEQRIEELHRPRMVRAGYWGTLDGTFKFFADGRVEGNLPPGDEVGMQISALYSLAAKHTWAGIASEFIRSRGNAADLMNFINSWLGEVFEQQVTASKEETYSAKTQATNGAPPARLLQPWVSRLIMTVDTQKSGFYWVVRGWGYGQRSHRVDHGQASTFEEVERIAFNEFYRYAGDILPPIHCYAVGIDSGGGKVEGEDGIDSSRTQQVYDWAAKHPGRVFALKGASHPGDTPIKISRVSYQPPGMKRGAMTVMLHLLDTEYFQDVLQDRIGAKTSVVDGATGEDLGQEDAWLLNDVDDPDYNAQLASMHKIIVNPRTKQQAWRKKSSGRANHYRDVEVYQFAMAYGPGRCTQLPPTSQLIEQHRLHQQVQSTQDRAPKKWGVRTPDGRPFLVTQR